MPIRCLTARTDELDPNDPEYFADPDDLYDAARDREDD